jgi:hypothetical protein
VGIVRNNNKTTTKNSMKKNKTNGPGRPAYVPVIPRGKFSFGELCVANGVNVKTGKGKNCSALTLRKFIARDAALGKKSQMFLTDELAEPNNKKGLGRKSFLYQRRAGVAAVKATVKSVRKATVKVSTANATAEYEKTKVELGLSAPAAETAPVEVAAEVTAPVAETPAAPVTA